MPPAPGATNPPRNAPCKPVVAADGRAALRHVSDIADVEVPVGAEHHDEGAPQPAAVTGNEHVHEFARDTVVAEHATVRERDTQEIAHVQILVGTEYHAAGPEERITRRAAPLR